MGEGERERDCVALVYCSDPADFLTLEQVEGIVTGKYKLSYLHEAAEICVRSGLNTL